MRRRIIVVGAALGILAGAALTFAPGATSQGMGGTSAPLEGVNILSAPRLEATVSTEPGTWLSVAGDSAGARLEVSVPNPITLNSSTQALLAGQRDCTYTALGRLTATPDGGVLIIPAGPTGGIFKAHGFGNNVDYVSCWPHSGGGPFPNCTLGDGGVGFDLHNHETMEVDLNTALSWRVDCRTCTHAGAPAQDNALVTGVVSICTPPP